MGGWKEGRAGKLNKPAALTNVGGSAVQLARRTLNDFPPAGGLALARILADCTEIVVEALGNGLTSSMYFFDNWVGRHGASPKSSDGYFSRSRSVAIAALRSGWWR